MLGSSQALTDPIATSRGNAYTSSRSRKGRDRCGQLFSPLLLVVVCFVPRTVYRYEPEKVNRPALLSFVNGRGRGEVLLHAKYPAS